jgi:hypothetical protein
VSNVGSIVSPWALGQVSQAFGVRLGMLVPMTGTVAMMCLALVVLAASRRQPAGVAASL